MYILYVTSRHHKHLKQAIDGSSSATTPYRYSRCPGPGSPVLWQAASINSCCCCGVASIFLVASSVTFSLIKKCQPLQETTAWGNTVRLHHADRVVFHLTMSGHQLCLKPLLISSGLISQANRIQEEPETRRDPFRAHLHCSAP